MPEGLPPMCGTEEFAELMAEMVAEDAPRLFAVVQEFGERVDARIAAWGLAHPGRVDVIGVDGTVHITAAAPETVLRRFDRRANTSTHLIWPT